MAGSSIPPITHSLQTTRSILIIVLHATREFCLHASTISPDELDQEGSSRVIGMSLNETKVIEIPPRARLWIHEPIAA